MEEAEEYISLWREVKEIKRRCQNATNEDMQKVTTLVRWFNDQIGPHGTRLKISACQIPNISYRVGLYLQGKNLIEKKESIYQ